MPLAPIAFAHSKAARVFSGRTAEVPRWATTTGPERTVRNNARGYLRSSAVRFGFLINNPPRRWGKAARSPFLLTPIQQRSSADMGGTSPTASAAEHLGYSSSAQLPRKGFRSSQKLVLPGSGRASIGLVRRLSPSNEQPEPTHESLRAEARSVYGLDVAGYDAGRPEYPQRVYEVLETRCGLRAGSVVLECGPGTGQVTRRLVEAGARVVAIEPDPAMAAYLRQALQGKEVEVIE